jgi:hypothetical protein
MDGSQQIVVCGTSIFVAAIESRLDAVGLGEVLAFNPHLPNVLGRITILSPQFVFTINSAERKAFQTLR